MISKHSFCVAIFQSSAGRFHLSLLQVGSHGIQASWAGGRKGREVIDRFLPQVRHLLSPNGVLYLVTIEENDTGKFRCL